MAQMRNVISVTLAIAGFGVLCSSASIAQEKPKPEDLIRETLQSYATAWNRADSRAIADLYTSDADYTGFGSLMTRGRGEIEARYTTLFSGAYAGTEVALDMSSLRFLKPDVAIVDGTLDLTHHNANGSAQTGKGLFIAIMTDDGGQWRFTTFWSKRLESVPTSSK
jgi:uncharacterized protein (TIGR02246 family)